MASAVTPTMADAAVSFSKILDAIDKMNQAAGAVLTAQPGEMTRRAEAMRDARAALEGVVQVHGRVVYNVLTEPGP
jgi:hypothetical protein